MKKEFEKGLYVSGIEFHKDYICFDKGDKYEFKPGLNIITGDQGCGKSTLLQIMTKQIEGTATIHTTAPTQFFYFDTEKDNPRMVGSIEYHKDPISVLQSKFQSHGEAILPLVLCIEQAKDTIIFLDEPEAGLSIRSQLKVIESIKTAISNGAQLIIATHSYFLIEMAGEVLSLEHKKWMSSEDFINAQKEIVQKKKRKTKKEVD